MATQSFRRSIAQTATWAVAGLGWRARALYGKCHDTKIALEHLARGAFRLEHSEARLIADSQRYWTNASNRLLAQHAHWRGAGIFADDQRWLALGREHLHIYREFAGVLGLKSPLGRIVEWGCGGGMNAVHFARETREFYGVDIAAATLAACAEQMRAEGLSNFTPILIDPAEPEAALSRLPGSCDLFLSTYVFEALPTPEYGLRAASQLLAPGGAAIIQVKYDQGLLTTRSRRWAYAENVAWHATYMIDEFWLAAQRCGFTPKAVVLVPEQPMVSDRNYAYFLLRKAELAAAPRSGYG